VGRLRLLNRHFVSPLVSFAVAGGGSRSRLGIERERRRASQPLVGWGVFDEARSIVGEHVDHPEFGEGREAHGAHPCTGEDKEGAAIGIKHCPWYAMPLRIAAMACSRTPKCR